MERFSNINGVKLHYTDTGNPSGKPVIIMHGWGCTLQTVVSIAQTLEGERRVINIDLPGHGLSAEPPLLSDGRPWGVEEYASAIEVLMSELSLETPAIVGHSYGGRVAIILASRNDIEKVVLVDSAGIKPKRPLKYYIKVYGYKTVKRLGKLLLGKRNGEKFIAKVWKSAGTSDYRNSSPVMRMVMSRSVNQDLKSYLPKIKAPTLLLWGEKDTATPLSDGELMEKLIPDAGLVVFKGAGHYSFLDNPMKFKAVLKSFFNIA